MQKFKKFLFPVLIIAVIVIQIAIPAYKIYCNHCAYTTGEEVKMRIYPITANNIDGQHIMLSFDFGFSDMYKMGKYCLLKRDDDKFVTAVRTTDEKPNEGLYLVSKSDKYFSIPFDGYFVKEKLSSDAKEMISGAENSYITIRIKGDSAVISGLYIDGVAVEELIK